MLCVVSRSPLFGVADNNLECFCGWQKNGHLLGKLTLFAVRGTLEYSASTAIAIREGGN